MAFIVMTILFMLEKIKKALSFLVEPKDKSNEDSARKEFILNVLLSGTLALSIICIMVSGINSFIHSDWKRHAVSMPILIGATIFFLVLYLLSKNGKARVSAYFFIATYFIFSVYTSYGWGVYVPQALLVSALVIVMSAVLISTRFAFITVILSSICISILFKLQSSGISKPDLYWMKTGDINIGDIVVYIATLFIIAIVSWLSNCEIEKSLKRARKSEAELKKERDMLEIRVEERTAELKREQYDKIGQMHKFAEFGRISSGLFHDITNYLTALSLNLEMAKENREQEVGNTRNYLEQAMKTSSKMEDFVQAIQKQLKNQNNKIKFSLVQEIEQAIQVLGYRSKSHSVEIVFFYDEDCFLFGNNFKFIQIITNIISNAIDSYSGIDGANKKVEMRLEKNNESIVISVKDRGCGISKENIDKIFTSFFTTKSGNEGTGVGLSTMLEILKNDFSGVIDVKSEEGAGTTMTLFFPISE